MAPIVDSDLHRLSVYLRFLIKKIEIESTGGIDITDKVLLEYYKLEKKTEGQIYLEGGEGVEIKVGGGSMVAEPEADLLSHIIEKLNERFGTSFSGSEKLAVEQIRDNLKANADLGLKAKNNSYDDFKYAFEPQFLEGVMTEYDKNQEFYGKILQDESFKVKLMDLIMLDIYASFNEPNKLEGYGGE